jgi:hypothetical protein
LHNEEDEFDRASKIMHERWLLGDSDPHPMKGDASNVLESPRFGSFHERHYEFSLTYDTSTYLRLLNTYSSYCLWEREVRASLFADLATLTDQQFGGHVVKRFKGDDSGRRSHQLNQRDRACRSQPAVGTAGGLPPPSLWHPADRRKQGADLSPVVRQP